MIAFAGMLLGLIPVLLAAHLFFLAFGINLMPAWLTSRASLMLACAFVVAGGAGSF